jgi:hypothetical protein
MSGKNWIRFTVFLVVATAIATGAMAQVTTGRLIGTVVDGDGVALPGATVRVNSDNLIGGERATVTDVNGEFRITGLPVGMYSVAVSLDGFVSQQISEVRVQLAGATPISVELPQGTFTEVVEVTAESPVIDTTQVSTEQIFDEDYLQNAAIGSGGRSYVNMLQQAAGADSAGEDGSNPSVFGSTSGENTFYIDGMDTTDPITSTWAAQMNFDVIQEVQLQSAGYEAEYGRTIGGVVNVLTKSGGNQFSGTFDLRFRNESFYESGDHYDASELKTQRWEAGATLGGPIARDKLWFFASYSQVDSDTTPSVNPYNTYMYEGKYPFAKLTWQPGQNWRVVGKYSGDPVTIKNDQANSSIRLDPDTMMNRDQGGFIAQAELNGVLSDSLMWNTIVGIKRSTLERIPVVGPDRTSHWARWSTGLITNVNTRQDYGDRNRDEFATDLTWFVDDFGGSHEFKFGYERGKFIEKDSTICATGSWEGEYGCAAGGTGGVFWDHHRYEDFQHPYYYYVTDNIPPETFEGDMNSFFAQDNWRPVPNLTIKAGLRWDDMVWSDNDGTERIWFDKLQPRIGFAWDITSDAKNVLRANWGRFMHPSNTSVPGFLTTSSGGRYQMVSCHYGGFRFGLYEGMLTTPEECQAWAADNGWDYMTDPEGWDSAGWWGPVWSVGAGGATTEVDPNLQPTYADEYGISYERAVGRRSSIEIGYLKKETRDIIEDTCRGNFYDGPSIDADCGNFLVFNYPERDYQGLTVKFESRTYSWMTLLASYTYSKAEGNADTRHVFYGDWDSYPWDWTNMYGYTMQHRPHRVKLNGFFNVRGDWTFGFDFFWADKFRYNTLTSEEGPGIPGGVTWLAEPRGTREGNTFYNLDLQISKGFRIADRVRVVLIGSVINATSAEKPFDANDICEDLDHGCYLDEIEDYVEIGDAIDWSDPRRYELGFRIEF